MTDSKTKVALSRESMTKEFIERTYRQPGLSKMADAVPTLEKQFQFPQKIWDKLKAKKPSF